MAAPPPPRDWPWAVMGGAYGGRFERREGWILGACLLCCVTVGEKVVWLFALVGSGWEGFLLIKVQGRSHLPIHLPNPAVELLTHPAPKGVYPLGQIGLGSNAAHHSLEV